MGRACLEPLAVRAGDKVSDGVRPRVYHTLVFHVFYSSRPRRRLNPTRRRDRKPPSQPRVAGTALPTGRIHPGNPAGWAGFRGAFASQAAILASLRWILGGRLGCRGWNLSGKRADFVVMDCCAERALRATICIIHEETSLNARH